MNKISSLMTGVLAFLRSLFSSKSPVHPEGPQEEIFNAVGTYYYLKNIARLATPNPDWKKTGKALVNLG